MKTKELNKWRLLGSNNTLEQLKEGITNYLHGSQIEFIEQAESLWQIKGKKGIMHHYRIIKKGKRYRFEITENKPTYF